LVQQGKVKEVMVYRDSFKADVYLTKEAKSELQKGEKKSDPLSMINVKPSPDFVLTYGDLRYFQESLMVSIPSFRNRQEWNSGKVRAFSQIFFLQHYSGLGLWRYSISSFSEKWRW
jgi:cell division protease FtsH